MRLSQDYYHDKGARFLASVNRTILRLCGDSRPRCAIATATVRLRQARPFTTWLAAPAERLVVPDQRAPTEWLVIGGGLDRRAQLDIATARALIDLPQHRLAFARGVVDLLGVVVHGRAAHRAGHSRRRVECDFV